MSCHPSARLIDVWRTRSYTIESECGGLRFIATDVVVMPHAVKWEARFWVTPTDPDLRRQWWRPLITFRARTARWQVGVGTAARQAQQRVLFVPHWLLVALAMIPIARRWLVVRRHYRRVALGLCERCGYDLRGSPARCPECGQISPAAEARANRGSPDQSAFPVGSPTGR
jgi:hypothetical protein